VVEAVDILVAEMDWLVTHQMVLVVQALGDRLRLPQMAAQETEQAMRAAVETLTEPTQAQAVEAVQDQQAQHLAFTA
jgi:hypothetical protein